MLGDPRNSYRLSWPKLKNVAIREMMNLFFRQAFVAEAGQRTKDAPGNQPVDGRMGNTEHLGGFGHGVGQKLRHVCRRRNDFRRERKRGRNDFRVHVPTLEQMAAIG